MSISNDDNHYMTNASHTHTHTHTEFSQVGYHLRSEYLSNYIVEANKTKQFNVEQNKVYLSPDDIIFFVTYPE